MNEFSERMLRIALVNGGAIPSFDSPIGELHGSFARFNLAEPSPDDILPRGAIGVGPDGQPTFVRRIDPDEVRAQLNPMKRGSNAIAARGSNVERLRADLDHRTRVAELEDWKRRKREELRSLRAELRSNRSALEADRKRLCAR